jgi:hypothetical protein
MKIRLLGWAERRGLTFFAAYNAVNELIEFHVLKDSEAALKRKVGKEFNLDSIIILHLANLSSATKRLGGEVW